MCAQVPGYLTVSTTMDKRVSPQLFAPSIDEVAAFSLTLLSFEQLATLTDPVPDTMPSSVVPHYAVSRLAL